MSESALSAAQRAAASCRDPRVLVTAAAGSGKTRVIVERFADAVINEKIPADRIVCITFTKKAAGVLKRRLTARFQAAGRDEDAILLEAGGISTIDGFCLKLLTEYSIDAGLDPRISILDEDVAALLRDEAAEEALEEAEASGDEGFGVMLEAYGAERLKDALIRLSAKYRSTPQANAPSSAGTPAADWERYLEECEAIAEAVAEAGSAAGKRKSELKAEALDRCAALTDAMAAHFARAMQALLERFAARYGVKKRERAALDFDDALCGALDLLKSERVRDRIRAFYRLVMVDEYQDVNALQARFIQSLAGASREFLVGDVRQSIYGFRGADCGQFLRRSEDAAYVQKPLDQNYRALPGVVREVNTVFQSLEVVAGRDFGGMKTDPDLPKEGAVDAIFREPEEGEGSAERRDAEASRVAAYAADLLASGTTIRDLRTGKDRAVRPGDIALLLRSTKLLGAHYENSFKAAGIPYYSVKGRGFYEKSEIKDLMNLLRAIADPDDDLALMGCLKSPLARVSDDGLAQIRRAAPGVSFYRALAGARGSDALGAEDAARIRRFLGWFEDLTARRSRLSVDSILAEAVAASRYDSLLLASEDGARRYTNLLKLKEKAALYSRAEKGGIARFIRFVERLSTHEIEEPEASLEAEESDAVQIMTVHDSKGLEFPVVILAGLSEEPPAKRLGPFLITSGGSVCAAIPKEWCNPPGYKRSYFGSRAYSEEASRLERFESEESLRVLYVAMTRARDRLALAGTLTPRGDEASESTWLGLILSAAPKLAPVTGGAGKLSKTRRAAKSAAPVDFDSLVSRLDRAPRVYRQTLLCTVSHIVEHELGAFTNAPQAAAAAAGEGGGRTDAAFFGNVFHFAMQHAPFLQDAAGMKSLETRLLPFASRLGPATAEILEAVKRFLADPEAELIRRAIAARAVYRELPFLRRIADASGDLGFISGQIDLLYRHAPRQWTIVDYKTGAERPNEHRRQILVYASCAARLLGEPVTRARLYYAKSGAFRDAALSALDSPAFDSELAASFAGLRETRLKNVIPA